MFFFSSEQFERIEVEDVFDGLASPLLLFAQIRQNYPPFFSADKVDKKQKKNLWFLNHLGLSSTNLLKQNAKNLCPPGERPRWWQPCRIC